MQTLSVTKKLAAVLAWAGFLFPAPALRAASPSHVTPPHTAVADVVLDNSGHFVGQLTNTSGQTVSHATVQLIRADAVVAEAQTNDDGYFRLPCSQGGSYLLAMPEDVVPIRIWTADVAPPNALAQVQVITGPTERGQSCTESCTESCTTSNGSCDSGCRGGSSCKSGRCRRMPLLRPLLLGTAIAAAIAIPLAVRDSDGS